MDYEKEYKKLKADIEKAYLFAQTDSTKAVLEHILPELKESEDEKTRKELLAWLKDKQTNPSIGFSSIKMEQWIAWLEKQGKQKSAAWGENDERMKIHTLEIIKKYWNSLPDTDEENEISESCYNWLKSLSPKKQWKPSEEQMEALLYETEAWDENSANGMNLTSLYNDLKKLTE